MAKMVAGSAGNDGDGVPLIDLSGPEDVVVKKIADACATYGFFQVTSHKIPEKILSAFRDQMHLYFDLPLDTKVQWKRNERNARGFFDDELTKQRRDWKEALDFGVPGSRDWELPDDDVKNACLDGFNQFPPTNLLPDFRRVMVEYFQECTNLSDKVAKLMAKGLGMEPDHELITDLKKHHSSYLRMNYYPTCPESTASSTLGIYPHQDAGFLTVLLQDDDCHSLQVLNGNNEWVTVHPVPGALTINTGDMAMIWSNGKYRAPLHRVLTNQDKVRYSAPFFYNPGYACKIVPIASEESAYEPCLWGYFRAVRFAGDLTDLGVEIQAADYEKERKSRHMAKQAKFETQAQFQEPFSVEKYRPLLLEES